MRKYMRIDHCQFVKMSILIIIFLSGCITGQSRSRTDEETIKMAYDMAEGFYKVGDVDMSKKLLERILEEYPAHEGAKELLHRIQKGQVPTIDETELQFNEIYEICEIFLHGEGDEDETKIGLSPPTSHLPQELYDEADKIWRVFTNPKCSPRYKGNYNDTLEDKFMYATRLYLTIINTYHKDNKVLEHDLESCINAYKWVAKHDKESLELSVYSHMFLGYIYLGGLCLEKGIEPKTQPERKSPWKKLRNCTLAIDHFNKILEKSPNLMGICLKAQGFKALAYEEIGQLTKARQEYQKILTDYPKCKTTFIYWLAQKRIKEIK